MRPVIILAAARAHPRRLAALAVAAIFAANLAYGVVAPAAPAAAGPPADLATVDAWFEGQVRDAGIPGAALVVVGDGRIVHERGFGTADATGRPVTAGTPFVIGSLSKSITALAVMQLVDAGEVDLDASIARYLPSFTLADPAAGARITVRDLLTHTSGIPTAAGIAPLSAPATSLGDQVEALRDVVPAAPAGERFIYSNANYLVLGRLVEVVSGQPFGAYLRAASSVPWAWPTRRPIRASRSPTGWDRRIACSSASPTRTPALPRRPRPRRLHRRQRRRRGSIPPGPAGGGGPGRDGSSARSPWRRCTRVSSRQGCPGSGWGWAGLPRRSTANRSSPMRAAPRTWPRSRSSSRAGGSESRSSSTPRPSRTSSSTSPMPSGSASSPSSPATHRAARSPSSTRPSTPPCWWRLPSCCGASYGRCAQPVAGRHWRPRTVEVLRAQTAVAPVTAPLAGRTLAVARLAPAWSRIRRVGRLVAALYLDVVVPVVIVTHAPAVLGAGWPVLVHIDVGLVLLAVAMLRVATGFAHGAGWIAARRATALAARAGAGSPVPAAARGA